MELMTKAERLELGKVVRLRAKVAKDDAEAQGRRLLADFEAQLAARYPENNPAWAEITATARQAVEDADAKIAQLCRSLGIPEEFRPGFPATGTHGGRMPKSSGGRNCGGWRGSWGMRHERTTGFRSLLQGRPP